MRLFLSIFLSILLWQKKWEMNIITLLYLLYLIVHLSCAKKALTSDVKKSLKNLNSKTAEK